jgi:hypothetical protein
MHLSPIEWKNSALKQAFIAMGLKIGSNVVTYASSDILLIKSNAVHHSSLEYRQNAFTVLGCIGSRDVADWLADGLINGFWKTNINELDEDTLMSAFASMPKMAIKHERIRKMLLHGVQPDYWMIRRWKSAQNDDAINKKLSGFCINALGWMQGQDSENALEQLTANATENNASFILSAQFHAAMRKQHGSDEAARLMTGGDGMDYVTMWKLWYDYSPEGLRWKAWREEIRQRPQ